MGGVMSDRQFPVLYGYTLKGLDWMPKSIPWSEAEKFREQAHTNHGQTLERLAERGGLAPEEILDAYNGMRLNFGKQSAEYHLEAFALVVKLAASPESQGAL